MSHKAKIVLLSTGLRGNLFPGSFNLLADWHHLAKAVSWALAPRGLFVGTYKFPLHLRTSNTRWNTSHNSLSPLSTMVVSISLTSARKGTSLLKVPVIKLDPTDNQHN